MAFTAGNQLQRIGHQARILEKRMQRILAEDGYATFDRAVRKQLKKAEAGDLAAMQFIMDRHDGKARSGDDVDGSDAKSISLNDLMHAILQARKAEAIEAAPAIANDNQQVEP